MPTHEELCAAPQRYMEFRLVGSGAKAKVFACRDFVTGRDVAYKVLRHDLDENPEEREALTSEARILAGMACPGIPTLFDLGLDGAGRTFCTQSLISGSTLRAMTEELRRGRSTAELDWPLHRIVQIVATAAEALAHAHQQGFIHCDLKPDNVIVDRSDRGWVVDWGIASPIAHHPGAAQTGKLRRGSPLYMSPEQAAHAHLDERTDVFGLGAVLYECLTLAPPAQGADVAAVLQSIATESPRPPRLRAPQRGISPELDEVCQRALARDPAQRFASMTEFQQALQECRLDLLEAAGREALCVSWPSHACSEDVHSADWWALQATELLSPKRSQ